MNLFQNIIARELIFNKESLSQGGSKITKINKEESKGLINRSPKIREVKESKEAKEHKMNRNTSMENFVKYSWSWTL